MATFKDVEIGDNVGLWRFGTFCGYGQVTKLTKTQGVAIVVISGVHVEYRFMLPKHQWNGDAQNVAIFNGASYERLSLPSMKCIEEEEQRNQGQERIKSMKKMLQTADGKAQMISVKYGKAFPEQEKIDALRTALEALGLL